MDNSLRTEKKIRALIADDESIARELLRELLTDEADVEIVALSSTGRDAADAINQLRPDLAFLDVHLPDLDGFGVLNEIRSTQMPMIIFVARDEQFAAKAFDVRAMDYLIKPCPRDRMRSALQRVRAQLNQHQANHLHERIEALLADIRKEPEEAERIAIKSEGRILFLRLSELDWIEAADNYVNLHTGRESHSLRETMNRLEARLPEKRFVRISRSAMVNIEHIREMQPMVHGEYVVVLRNGMRLTLTRGYREKLRQICSI